MNLTKEELKALSIQDLIQKIESNPEILELMISFYYIPKEFIANFIFSRNHIQIVIKACLNHDYIPNQELLGIILKYPELDLLFMELIAKFKDLKFTNKEILNLINHKFLQSALQIISSNEIYQSNSLIMLLIESNVFNEKIKSLILTNTDLLKDYIKYIGESKLIPIQDEYFILQILDSNYFSGNSIGIESFINNLDKKNLSPQILTKIFQKLQEEEKFSSHNRHAATSTKLTESIEYNIHFESVNLDTNFAKDLKIINSLVNVPQESKYRKYFLIQNPTQIENHEIPLMIKEVLDGYVPDLKCFNILSFLCKQPMSIIAQYPKDIFTTQEPSKLRDILDTDMISLESKLYIYENVPSKYHFQLNKIIKLKDIPENNNKKSYFQEIIIAIKNEDYSAFLKYTTGKYSLLKFCQDTNQKSKIITVENMSISGNFANLLKKDEFIMLLTKSKLSISHIDKIKVQLSVDECILLHNHFSDDLLFEACTDKALFLKKFFKETNDDSYQEKTRLNRLTRYSIELFKQNKVLMETLFKVMVETKTEELSDETILLFLQNKTREEVKSIITLDQKNLALENFIDIKSPSGVFFVTDDEILEIIKENPSCLENSSFISALFKRNKPLLEKLFNLYLKGNKALSEYFGSPIRITKRNKIDEYSNKLKNIDKSIIEYLLDNNNTINLNHIKSNTCFTLDDIFQCDVSPITIEEADSNDFEYELAKCDLSDKLLVINNLTLGNSLKYSSLIRNSNIKIKKVTIESNADLIHCPELYSVLEFYELKDERIEFESENSKLLFKLVSLNFINKTKYLELVNRMEPYEVSRLDFNQILFLGNNGYIFSKKIIMELIENCFNDENNGEEILNFIISRIGSLNGYVIDSGDILELDEENPLHLKLVSLIKKHNGIILDSNEFKLFELKKEINNNINAFSNLSIDFLDSEQKLDLIDFVEEIDTRFKSIQLKKTNLKKLNTISNYNEFIEYSKLDSSRIKEIFCISQQNNKLIDKIVNYISLEGNEIVSKIIKLKEIIKTINNKIELSHTDFIEETDTINESELLRILSHDKIDLLHKAIPEAVSHNFLTNQSKGIILRFLRSIDDFAELKDTFALFTSCINGLYALNDDLTNYKIEGQLEEIEQTQAAIDGLTAKFNSIAQMDTVTHIHDRLVQMAQFLKVNVTESLNQKKYKKLENNPSIFKEFNYYLYFPKTRNELISIGGMHGWCVDTQSSYGDGVINNNNILVGICRNESSIEAMIALAHFEFADGEYTIEQIKWSILEKQVKNEDASSDFDHMHLLRIINKHLDGLKNENIRSKK